MSKPARHPVASEANPGEPLRQIPGFKKPAPTWQDEVRERVARRKRQRDEMRAVTPALEQQPELSRDEVEAAVASLDQFGADGLGNPEPAESRFGSSREPPIPMGVEPAFSPAPEVAMPAAIYAEPPDSSAGDELDALDQMVGSVALDRQSPTYDASIEEGEPEGHDQPARGPELSALDQLSFRASLPSGPPPEPEPPSSSPEEPAASEDDGDDASPTWSFDLEPPARHVAPVERPAFVLERAEAVAVDLLILGTMSGVVAYFAARVAQVPFSGLLSGLSYIAAFVIGVGLLYATCFTGTTGQTPGKMLVGLRVVDTHGNPPGASRALLRSVLALVGLACLGLGAAPIFLDPARRAAHDRLVGTRVVRP